MRREQMIQVPGYPSIHIFTEEPEKPNQKPGLPKLDETEVVPAAPVEQPAAPAPEPKEAKNAPVPTLAPDSAASNTKAGQPATPTPEPKEAKNTPVPTLAPDSAAQPAATQPVEATAKAEKPEQVVYNADFKTNSTTPVTDDDWFDTAKDVYGRYKNMTDTEKAIYNYYFNTQGEDAAEEYYDSIAADLNYRQAELEYQHIEGKPLLQMEYGLRAGFDQFLDGAAGLVNSVTGSEAQVPTSTTQYVGAMAREDLEDKGPKVFGSSLGQLAYDVLSTAGNMAPSMVAGIINPAAGAGLLGASAAGNAYTEMINEGYSKDQARTYAALVGGSEAGLSYLFSGISKLGGKVSGNVIGNVVDKVDNILGKVAVKLGGKMLSEGAEEGLQEILTPWFQQIATGIQQEKANWEDVAYASLLGMLTAFFSEGSDAVKSAKAPVDAGKAAKVGWDGRAVAKEATGSKITVDGVTYELLGYDEKGLPVYQDAEVLREQAAKEKAVADQGRATQVENGQESVENSENRDKMKIGVQFFAEKTLHANERIEQRNLSEAGMDDALASPLHKGDVIVDDTGRKSVKYIGKDITVILNPDTGEVITAWKTGSRIRRKYGGD